MKTLGRLGVATFAALSLSACATVTRGTSQTFYVMSEPSNAKVEMSNNQTCVTPCQLKLKRKDEFDVTVSLDGYKSKTTHIESRTKGGGVAAAAGNVLVGGIIGGVVDGSNGSMKNLLPNPLKVILAPSSSTEESQVVAVEKPQKTKSSKK